MGGAERNARKRKQQRTAVSKAATASGGTSRTTIVAVASVIVLAVAVIGGIVWTNSGSGETAGEAIPAVEDPGKLAFPGSREDVTVVQGSEDAKATIDVYEDLLCPICGRFEEQYGAKIDQKVQAGELRVRYHMVPLLVEASNPPGYSLDAANAALCAADAGKFERYHDSLFAAQPAEGGSGYDNSQLIQLGRKIGIQGGTFAQCVKSNKYDKELNAALDQILQNPDLKQTIQGRKSFGTPTVVADGKVLNVFQNPNWLSNVLSGSSQ